MSLVSSFVNVSAYLSDESGMKVSTISVSEHANYLLFNSGYGDRVSSKHAVTIKRTLLPIPSVFSVTVSAIIALML